jgi:hypothetical protein
VSDPIFGVFFAVILFKIIKVKILQPDDLSDLCNIVLDAAHVFGCNFIIDTSIDAFTCVFVGEVLLEIAVSSQIYLLVMAMPWPTVAPSVPTTVITTSYPTTTVVWRATAAMCARPWRGPTLVGLVRSDFRVGDGLRPSKKICRLSHGRDQVCPYIGPETLAFWRV